MRLPVFVGRQANKIIFTGTVTAEELVKELRSQTIAVNPDAQRSLAKGADKDTTAELLENDTVHKTQRMKDLTNFLKHVMESMQKGENTEGFFGSLQLAIPVEFTGATLEMVPETPADNLPATLNGVLKALPPSRKLGVLNMHTRLGTAAMNISDGQGRSYSFHSLERMCVQVIVQARAQIKKKEKAGLNVTEDYADLRTAEHELARVRTFLAETDISFVCYASMVRPDGTVVGLSDSAQKRQYIEGNALNSRASQEEMVKYEQFSPVVVLLHEMREYNSWMSTQHIEEDTKTISVNSKMLFTLSALTQAFGFSIIGNNKPLKVEKDHFDKTVEHRGFVEAFWNKVTAVFGPLWVPPGTDKLTRSERVAYLQRHRGDNRRNVTFQAIFLMALGRLCYQMGKQVDWDPTSKVIDLLDHLSPNRVEYDAVRADGSWNEVWTSTMMKQAAMDPKKPESRGYVFNNSRENITATFRQLASLAGFAINKNADEDEELGEVAAE